MSRPVKKRVRYKKESRTNPDGGGYSGTWTVNAIDSAVTAKQNSL